VKRQGAAFPFDSSSQWWLSGVGLAVALGIAYFLAARLGLALRVEPGIAPFWPAAGIAVGALIALGPGVRLPVAAAVVVATAAANVTTGRNPWLASAFGLVNAGQSLFTAWLIERWFGRAFNLEDAPQVVGFLVASAVGAAMAAAGAAVAVSLVHSAASCPNVWRLWFASCLLGIVTVAPLLIALDETLRDPPTRRESIEGAIVLTTLIALSAFLFSVPEGSWAAALREAVVFPFLLWVAIRCRPVFAAAATFVVALTVIGSTTFSIVHFGEVSLPLADRMLAAQTFALTAGVSVLLVAALFADRRRSESSLKVSAERLQLALDGAELGALSADLATGLFECDGRAARIHGHDLPPTTIQEARRFVHPDDLVHFDAAVAQAKRTGGVGKAEYRVMAPPKHPKAGEVRWVALEASILSNGQGTPVRLLGVTRDITHHKQSQQALAERDTQLALAGKIALVGTFTFDIGSGRMQVSPGYAALHGLLEGTVETSRADWRTRVHPDDLPRLDVRLQRAIAHRERDHYCEFRIVRSNGECRWIEARSSISYDGNGSAHRIIGANIDVTDRKRTEADLKESEIRLADALAAGQVIAFEWDALTGQSRRSDNAPLILGDEYGTTNSRCNDFLRRVHPDDREHFRRHIRELCPNNPSYALNFRYCCSDGRHVWLEETARGEFDATGRLLRVKGLTRDTTERKRAEERQCALLAELDHRVKNVLATVSAVASHTLDSSNSMEQFVAALDGRIRSMASTHELLSRCQWRGALLGELIRRELAPYATSDNTEISGPEVMLSAEAAQALAMVFHELATNAAKYGALSMRQGRILVRWRCPRNGARDPLVIEWHETGGPSVKVPSKSGYGTIVVADLVPYELGGTTNFALTPEGVRCRLEIPARWFSTGRQPSGRETQGATANAGEVGERHAHVQGMDGAVAAGPAQLPRLP
jgi:PAS domain S-box-containing protein